MLASLKACGGQLLAYKKDSLVGLAKQRRLLMAQTLQAPWFSQPLAILFTMAIGLLQGAKPNEIPEGDVRGMLWSQCEDNIRELHMLGSE